MLKKFITKQSQWEKVTSLSFGKQAREMKYRQQGSHIFGKDRNLRFFFNKAIFRFSNIKYN